jgi:WhiB family transcriptional regulator, redox-sensing transcriptional regulator
MAIAHHFGSPPWADDRPDIESLFQRPAWHALAACRGQGTADFFPARGESLESARAFCDRCPVQTECLKYAMEAEEPRLMGIWAGTTDRQRLKLRKVSA